MFTIMLWDAENLWTDIATISDYETAYIAYRKACEFAKLVGKECYLIDAEAGEILEAFEDEDWKVLVFFTPGRAEYMYEKKF